MTKMNSRFEGHEEHHFPCDCGDWHYLEVTWDDEDSEWRYLSVADSYHFHKWKDRIKAVFDILRGKVHYHSGILLTGENLRELKEVINKY